MSSRGGTDASASNCCKEFTAIMKCVGDSGVVGLVKVSQRNKLVDNCHHGIRRAKTLESGSLFSIKFNFFIC